jgi:hypothetical protein
MKSVTSHLYLARFWGKKSGKKISEKEGTLGEYYVVDRGYCRLYLYIFPHI